MTHISGSFIKSINFFSGGAVVSSSLCRELESHCGLISCLLFYIPLKNFSLMDTLKAVKLKLMLGAFKQEGIFIVPRLL